MGSVNEYKNKDGKRLYKIRFYIPVDPLTGKGGDSSRQGFKSRREANLELSRIELQIDEGTYRKKQAETYQDVYDLWVVQYKRSVEESTFVKTIGIFRNHILPAIGTHKIAVITFADCQEATNKWADDLKNCRMVKSYAATVLDFAIKHDFIQKNPFDYVEVTINKNNSRFEDKDKFENFYTKEQLLTFLTCMKKETNVKAYVFFQLLAFSGMRKGEAFALTWKDIEFKKNEIRINKAISQGEANRLYGKTTKTGEHRTIKMYPESIPVLKMWKKQQSEDFLMLGIDILEDSEQLVFSNRHNEYIQPTKSREWLEDTRNKYELAKITTHGFRHTHCSLMFEAGATLKEVQDRLGHADVKTTMNIYAHVSDKAKSGAVDKLASFMTT